MLIPKKKKRPLPRFPRGRRGAGLASAPRLESAAAAAPVVGPAVTAAIPLRRPGADIVTLGLKHVGELYVLGARAPMANPNWTGPWDCAEFASWCVYQSTGVLYGVRPERDPVRADAYTGFWGEQAERDHATVPIEDAVRIAGACLLRKPGGGPIGHIAISCGDGTTVEAHSAKRGVTTDKATGRRWDYGVLVPGVEYLMNEKVIKFKQPDDILRLTTPFTSGSAVKKVQVKLAALGYSPGTADGVFGPQTASAVMAFQADQGMVADGEVGAATRKALGV